MRRTVIFAIGNELLIGETLDTNTNWLCRQLTGLGAHIEWCQMLPDRLEFIAEQLQFAMAQSAELIVTTGGLGPTDDDLTLTAVARACNLALETNTQANQWVTDKYRQLAEDGYVTSAEMNPARTKMAIMPIGAQAIFNPVGSAPAMLLKHQQTTIISLPGVPSEMLAIVERSLPPFLRELLGAGAFQERTVRIACGDESFLAPLLREVVSAHPQVYIKSKAKGFGPDAQIFQVILHARGPVTELSGWLDQAEADLKQICASVGLKIEE